MIVRFAVELEAVKAPFDALATMPTSSTRRLAHRASPLVATSGTVNQRFTVNDIQGVIVKMWKTQRQVSINARQVELDSQVTGAVWKAGEQVAVSEADLREPFLLRRLTQEFTHKSNGHDLGIGAFLMRLSGKSEYAAEFSSLHIIVNLDVHE